MKRSLLNIESKPDANTLLLLHFDRTLNDATGLNNGVYGSGFTYSTKSKFGESVYFGTNESYIKIPFNLRLIPDENITVDFWVYASSSISQAICLYGNPGSGQFSGIQLGCGAGGVMKFYYYNGGEVAIALPTITLNTWHHIALVYESGSFLYFVDGVLLKQFQITFSNSQNDLLIGHCRDLAASLMGYIDEYRISNIARWTSNFTPPTKPYFE